MKPLNLESELRGLLTECLRQDVSQVEQDVDLVRELGLDSLAKLQLLAVLEKDLGIRFQDEGLAGLRTLRQLMEAIQEAQEKKLEAI